MYFPKWGVWWYDAGEVSGCGYGKLNNRKTADLKWHDVKNVSKEQARTKQNTNTNRNRNRNGNGEFSAWPG